jgi:hypothetical protein
MLGNVRKAGLAGAGATTSGADLANNMRFYSALAPDSGAVDSSGLPESGGAD